MGRDRGPRGAETQRGHGRLMAVAGPRDLPAPSGTVIGLSNETWLDDSSGPEVRSRQDPVHADARHGDTRPMRSPSAGSVEDSSSARFQPSRRSNPPDGIPPVEGLRMRQVFDHEPVMEAEVVSLFAPVPPGVVIDATVGGGGHAAGTPRGAPSSPCARARPRSRRRRPPPPRRCRGSGTAPPCAMPPSTIWRTRSSRAARPRTRSPVSCSTWVSARRSSTRPSGASRTATTDHSTCAWTRRPARPPPTS